MNGLFQFATMKELLLGEGQSLSHLIETWWPIVTTAVAIAWLFIWLARSYLSNLWLRWAVATIVGSAMLIPIGKLSLSGWLLALVGPLSGFSLVLLLASIHLGSSELLPKSSWLIVCVLCILRLLDTLGFIPFALLNWAFLDQATSMSLALTTLALVLLTLSIAVRRPFLGFCALIPAFLWRLDAGPFQNLWNAYTDLALMVASVVALTRRSTKGKP